VLELDAPDGQVPMLSVFGGKVTTFRHLAEAAMDRLAPFLPGVRGPWTAGASLPGGDFPWDGTATLRAELAGRYPFLPAAQLQRLVRTYGTRTAALLGDARTGTDLGQEFGAGFTQREADWLRREEWATSVEDMLWRRTKRGLHIAPDGIAALRAYLGD
jgi:glycerol-3-phosphate dehydrogenase